MTEAKGQSTFEEVPVTMEAGVDVRAGIRKGAIHGHYGMSLILPGYVLGVRAQFNQNVRSRGFLVAFIHSTILTEGLQWARKAEGLSLV